MPASTHSTRLVKFEAIESAARPLGAATVEPPARSTPVHPLDAAGVTLEFDDVYRTYFPFVWRSAKRLGGHEAALDDIVQEVFVVVHRRLADFAGRSALRTWLFGITLRVVRDHRRSLARKSPEGCVEPDSLLAAGCDPGEALEKAEAVRLLYSILSELEDQRREVFVMAELEQLPMADIATLLDINVNTAYARVRVARQSFERLLARRRLVERGRTE
jgi:RNA polymerase sigma-70 factor (ECF subfamily)